MKYRLCFTGTFQNVKSVYTEVYNLKVKCDCGNVHEKRINLCHDMQSSHSLGKDSDKNSPAQNNEKSVVHATEKIAENQKLSHKIKKESFNLIITCKDCKSDMRIKIRDMEKKKDVLGKVTKNKSKRGKRKNKYRIKWVDVDLTTGLVLQPENNDNKNHDKKNVDEKNVENQDVSSAVKAQAKGMKIDLDNLDKKQTSKKHHEPEKPGILENFYSQSEKKDSSVQNANLMKVPLMPFKNNVFILSILELRNCSLLEDVKVEMNVLSDTHLWQNVIIDEGVWKEGDCEIVDGNLIYERV